MNRIKHQPEKNLHKIYLDSFEGKNGRKSFTVLVKVLVVGGEIEQVLDGHLDAWTHDNQTACCGCVKAFEVYFCGQFDVISFFMAEKSWQRNQQQQQQLSIEPPNIQYSLSEWCEIRTIKVDMPHISVYVFPLLHHHSRPLVLYFFLINAVAFIAMLHT